MIYVTIGTMFLDFPRLLRKMDALAAGTKEPVIMQTGLSVYTPQHAECFDFKPHGEVLDLQRQARVIIAHAGIGATLDALAARRPFVLVPRLKQFNEHTNDHQRDIAEAVQRRGWGRMILDVEELDEACANPPPFPESYRPAKERLIGAVRRMVDRVAEAQSRR